MNPIKSFLRQALKNGEPEPDIDRPRLRTQKAMGGGLVFYEPRADEADAWVHGGAQTLVDLREGR